MKLALKPRNAKKLVISLSHSWESVFPDALHSIQFLLCTTANETSHERMSFPRWLNSPGSVYLKRYSRISKYHPEVHEVEFAHSTPNNDRVCFSVRSEASMSSHDIAPLNGFSCALLFEQLATSDSADAAQDTLCENSVSCNVVSNGEVDKGVHSENASRNESSDYWNLTLPAPRPVEQRDLRRSTRLRKPVGR